MLLSPVGKEQYHLGSLCGKSWDGRLWNVTSGIGSLGMNEPMAKPVIMQWPGIKGGHFKN